MVDTDEENDVATVDLTADDDVDTAMPEEYATHATMQETNVWDSLATSNGYRDQVWTLLQILLANNDVVAMFIASEQIATWCQSRDGKCYKDVLRRAGVLQVMVKVVVSLEGRAGNRELCDALFRALAETVYDERANAEAAARYGLLLVAGRYLSRMSCDDPLAEHVLCVVNNVIGMSQETHALLEEANIIPLLVKFAGSSRTSYAEGAQQIATAALANLSNNHGMRGLLISSGAVQVLALELQQYRSEEEEEVVRQPSVSYMQALSAVVKIVGGSSNMGRIELHPSCNRGCEEQQVYSFRVDGDRSSACYTGDAVEMVLDRRSVEWMLDYFKASVDGRSYPAGTSIYGTAWKVALSMACIARGGARNRALLVEAGAWELLCDALATPSKDAQDQPLTDLHVVTAMRLLLRADDEVLWSRQRLLKHPRAEHVLSRLAQIAANTAMPLPARHGAATVLNTWDRAWAVERLLWLAVYKPCHKNQVAGPQRLHGTMVRNIMNQYMLLGGGRVGCQQITANVAG